MQNISFLVLFSVFSVVLLKSSDKNAVNWILFNNSESSTLDFLQKYELVPNTSDLPNCIKYSSDTKMYIREKN